jgi:hypothetical protein
LAIEREALVEWLEWLEWFEWFEWLEWLEWLEWPEWLVAATALLKIVQSTKAMTGACSKSLNPDSHPEVCL